MKKFKYKKPPMQPVGWDGKGVVRFQGNAVVRQLLDQSSARGFDLNNLSIACQDAPQADWEQFAQLIGYSVSGFGDLSYASPETIDKADRKVDRLVDKR